MASEKIKGLICVIGGIILHLFLGCFYLWGNIQVYITSYLHKHDPSITLEDTNVVFVLLNLGQTLSMPIGPLLFDYLPVQLIFIIGASISIGGVFISSFVTNLYLYELMYPLCFGLGIGFCYMPAVMCGWEYFPQWKGAVTGSIIAGFGFASFIFGFVSIAITNPDGEQAELKVAGGKIFSTESPVSSNAPSMLRIMCGIWCVFLILALLMIHRNTASLVPQIPISSARMHSNDVALTSMAEQAQDTSNSDYSNEPTLGEALRDYRVYYLYAAMFLASSFPYFIASSFKTYEQIDLHDDRFITLVGSLGAVTNGLSRGVWATLMDFIGYKKVVMGLLTLEIIIAFTFVAVHEVKTLYLIWVLASFSILGGQFATLPTLCGKIFGLHTGGKIFTIIFSTFLIVSFANYIFATMEARGYIEYSTLFYILGLMATAALCMIFFLDVSPHVKTLSSKDHDKQRNDNKIEEQLVD
ncbi:unnamed protein product [Moneuplotes crassus]|uniref:Major facilitator superfamily (MFS) profile domain-containing protein n=1 Tax=Euplotes crassus TaxID=5936 RepID=A0AAD1XDR9_EUPCR|nr:unnamed protein product [Moneuplotes crassus]